MLTARVLPADEWGKLADLEPWKTVGLPSAERAAFVILESETGEVAAVQGIVPMFMLEGLYVKPELRGGEALKQLWSATAETVRACGNPTMLTITQSEQLARCISRVGFERVNGIALVRTK